MAMENSMSMEFLDGMNMDFLDGMLTVMIPSLLMVAWFVWRTPSEEV